MSLNSLFFKKNMKVAVYASILDHLTTASEEPRCFITKNSKDFANPDIENELTAYNCHLLTKFADGLGYVRSQL